MVPAIVVPPLLAFGLSRLFDSVGIEDAPLLFATLVALTSVVGLALLATSAAPLERAHRALEATRSATRELVQQAPDGIFVADLDGRYTDVNPAGCEMLGFSREELVGKTIVEFRSPPRMSGGWRLRNSSSSGVGRTCPNGDCAARTGRTSRWN